MMRSTEAFSAQPVKDRDALIQAVSEVEFLSVPAGRKWVLARVMTMMSHYHATRVDEKVMEAMAEDWAQELKAYPAWAISNAVRWWMGRENPRRSFKPVPGEISDRCHIETNAVRAAAIMIDMAVAKGLSNG